jgi:hypothetical protein
LVLVLTFVLSIVEGKVKQDLGNATPCWQDKFTLAMIDKFEGEIPFPRWLYAGVED